MHLLAFCLKCKFYWFWRFNQYQSILSKKCNFLVRLGIKSIFIYFTTTIPLFSFIYGPVFTYLCIIWHQCNAFESNFKETLDIQGIFIHQKASYLVSSLFLHMQQVLMCRTIWCHYIDDFISSDLIGQKFLNVLGTILICLNRLFTHFQWPY